MILLIKKSVIKHHIKFFLHLHSFSHFFSLCSEQAKQRPTMTQVVRRLEEIYASIQDEDFSQHDLKIHSLPTLHEEDAYATESEASKAATAPANLPSEISGNAGAMSI